NDEAQAEAAARALAFDQLDDARLRMAAMGEPASIVAAFPAVRAALMDFQRNFANQPGGAVLDGRDIGSVTAPHADVKIFVTASTQARAERRYREALARGEPAQLEAIQADIARRDARDRNRAEAPLQPAPDAVILDTTNLSIDQAFAAAEA